METPSRKVYLVQDWERSEEYQGTALRIVVGFQTCPVSVILALEMVIACFIARQPQGGVPTQNGGELALLYALSFALLAIIGPGKFGVDEQ